MNLKNKTPFELVVELLDRSTCHVQVAAVLYYISQNKVWCWGWNHMGPDGFGEHAEIHCLKRANPSKVFKSAILIAARRRKSGNIVTARPCIACLSAVRECGAVLWRDKDGLWKGL